MFTEHGDDSDHLQREITSPEELIMKGFKAIMLVCLLLELLLFNRMSLGCVILLDSRPLSPVGFLITAKIDSLKVGQSE